MIRKKAFKVLLPALGSALLLMAGIPAGATGTAAQDDGQRLLETRCGSCHGTGKVTQAQKDKAQWGKNVNRMIKRGASLTDAEKKTLIDYLSENYGK